MYDFKETEDKIKSIWKKEQLLGKLQKKNQKGKNYFYLDGPPYANFIPHVGHIRNTVYKDFGIRLAFMRGFNVLFQPGFDTHGLPVENMVEKKLNLVSKKDIEKMGSDNFTKSCKDWAATNKDLWLETYGLLGSWYSWKEPYLTYNNDYLQSGWWSFKQLWDRGLVYEGQKPVFWCPKCETALSGYEVTDSYIMKVDPSIILKFKLKKKNEYLLVFTTTPWTLLSNTSVVAKGDEIYVRVETMKGILILAKKRLELLAELGIGYKLLEEFKGKELDGLEYEPIINVPIQKELEKNPRAHKVYMSIPILKERIASKVATKKNVGESGDVFEHFVSVEEGTGLVHTAPGHGKTDNEIGQHYKLPEASPLDDSCRFTNRGGQFEGIFVKDADKAILELLDREGKLLHQTTAEHKYPVCWRCKSPLIFRMSNQWFVKIDRNSMINLNKQVRWLPDYANERFENWVLNAEDWNISRQRYWGIPIPVWKCSCGKIEVISSLDELKKKAKITDNFDLHNASKIKLKCKCGKEMTRIKDIFDVWYDAGIAPWASLGYPFKNKELFENFFPVAKINESQDQVRGWFYYLLYCSQAVFNKPSYLEVSMPGWVLDSKGQKMSKSLGNVIHAKEILEKYGADAVRFYYMWDIAPYDLQKFSVDTIEKEILKFFTVYWNLHNYVLTLENYNKTKLTKLEDRWIISKLNSLILEYNKDLNNFEYHLASRKLADFILNDFSRTYVHLVRDRINEEEVSYVLIELMKNVSILLAPICPFITDDVFLNLGERFKFKEESVHLCEWVEADEKLIDKKLEESFDCINEIIPTILAVRERAGISVRWPLAKLTIASKDREVKKSVEKLKEVILSQVNVKKLDVKDKMEGIKFEINLNKTTIGREFKQDSVEIIKNLDMKKMKELVEKKELKIGNFNLNLNHVNIKEEIPKDLAGGHFSKGGVYLDIKMNKDLEDEGFTREVVRQVQSMRKDAGLVKKDRINVSISGDYDLKRFSDEIKKKIGANKIYFEMKEFDNSNDFEVKGKIFKISFEKS